jgi:hypothetical protein
MARHLLSLLFCAGVLIAAPPALPVGPEEPKDRRKVEDQVAVQGALGRARAHMKDGHFLAAVEALEGQLHLADGSPEYLGALRDAYAGCVEELKRANRAAEAAPYQRALARLDPRAALDPAPTPAAPSAPPTPGALVPPPPPTLPTPKTEQAPAKQAKPTAQAPQNGPGPGDGSVVRASRGEEDVFAEANSKQGEVARDFRARADKEFLAHHYEAAAALYDQAGRADKAALAGAEEPWAYCKLFAVNEALKKAEPPPAADLEREVRTAMSLAPKLDPYGKDLLFRIRNRAVGAASPAAPPADRTEETPVEVRHHARGQVSQSYAVAETANFRVFHNQTREVAEKAARVAEAARTAGYRKWFGDAGGTWNPRCDLYLHATAQDYTQATGQHGDCPGHSTVGNDRENSERIISRRLDIHVDVPEWWVGVLPHETTHVVLAGRFGPQPLPRWADEGMAVLAEPRDRVERHLRNLPMHSRNGELFAVGDLMRMSKYPEPRLIGAFYAESVSLVDFLSRQPGGPPKFAQFLRDCPRLGHENALKQHYGFDGFADLEARWKGQAFAGGYGQAGAMAEK